MNTNRTVLKACIASLALCAGTAGAQIIYKQVDADGRVIFTDQPNPSARMAAAFETTGPAWELDEMRRDEPRTESPTEARTDSPRRDMVPNFTAPERMRVADDPAPHELKISPVPLTPTVRTNDVERAVFSYKPLDTPLAAQVDATEAARRLRQDAYKNPVAAGVLVVTKPAPSVHEPVKTLKMHEDVDGYYYMWAITFFLLAGGLLYMGWQTIKLVLSGAFPRWNLGAG